MKTFADIGVQIPQIYLPRKEVNLTKWAVIACDQYTSQPEYWKKVEDFIGNEPSTYHLVLPEVFLGNSGVSSRIHSIQEKMKLYLENGTLVPHEGFIYVERTVLGKTRRGLMLSLDLERYDYHHGSISLIRATEGTILERLPPRMKIRKGASLEVPHILVLIDDPGETVLEPLAKNKERLKKLYDFPLMFNSGHLKGYSLDQAHEAKVIASLQALAKPENFASKYGLEADTPVLLFAMGDGNHSLATAKATWESEKHVFGMDHPSRYALVEIENVHDEGLSFEPIHRILFGVKKNMVNSLRSYLGEMNYLPVSRPEEMIQEVEDSGTPHQRIGMIEGGTPPKFGVIDIFHPTSNLPVGTLQSFLDEFIKENGAEKVDYIHGREVIERLGSMNGNVAFYLPPLNKSDLFKTVILDGALPRKTFSMGEAQEKRFYMEARKIV